MLNKYLDRGKREENKIEINTSSLDAGWDSAWEDPCNCRLDHTSWIFFLVLFSWKALDTKYDFGSLNSLQFYNILYFIVDEEIK